MADRNGKQSPIPNIFAGNWLGFKSGDAVVFEVERQSAIQYVAFEVE